MTSKKRQVQINEIRKLEENNTKKEQSTKEALFKENFIEA